MINNINELLNTVSEAELRQIIKNAENIICNRETARRDELKSQILNLAKTWNEEFPYNAIWADIECEDCEANFTEDLMDLIIRTLS